MSRPSTKGFFVRERLTEAREARGLTQAKLAKALDKSGATISNWERGEQTPEPPTLDLLARILDVSPAYFGMQIPEHGHTAIFFRSFASAAIRARTRAKARVRWLQHISLSLQHTLEFPRVDFPNVIDPHDYKKLTKADLEQLAAELRKHWGLGEGAITNMVLVAENAGVVVGVDVIGSTKIDGQGNWSDADGRPYILLARDKNTAFRRQMDVAHELAHLCLHRGVEEKQLEEDFDLIEEQAKYFAGALLLPARSFAAQISSLSLDGFKELKQKWMVSIGAMIMRAAQIELLSEAAEIRLWKYRTTRGWHQHEPYDSPDETPVSEPLLLRRSIEMIVDKKVRTKRDLLDIDIGLGANDVEILASLKPGYFYEGANVIALEPRLRDQEKGIGESASIVPFKRQN